jgi:hypothetical protein
VAEGDRGSFIEIETGDKRELVLKTSQETEVRNEAREGDETGRTVVD